MTGSLHARRRGIRRRTKRPDDGFSTSSIRVHAFGRCRELPELVFLPGLDAPGYLVPLLREVAGWTRATVLELPGWRGGRARSCPSTVVGIGTALDSWLAATGRQDVVLVGHSTGAQAVLYAVRRPAVAGVVLAGPTFTPAARGVPGLLRALAATLPRERTRRGAARNGQPMVRTGPRAIAAPRHAVQRSPCVPF